ncbi:hypothetical protein NESM_000827600 [Novymonas esmeraldas]|uniref:Uncharacterized protein n=1 Tax=Novymonas esmeraldas TaxID=1808958 RepID=A0AAW0EWD8_9TRYP
MNVDDPFANDLAGFRSIVTEMGRPTSSSPSPVSGGGGGGVSRGGGTAASPPFPSGLSTRSVGSPAGLGAASPTSVMGSSGVATLFGPSPTSAPVAGRRARQATPGAPGVLAASPSSAAPSVAAAVGVRGDVVPASSPLSWLDDIDAAPPPSARTAVLPGRPGAPPPHRPPGPTPSSSPLSPPPAAAQHEQLPSFLDSAFSTTSSPAMAAAHALPTRTSSAGTAATSAAAVEAERKKKELRDLYATLDAVVEEERRLQERLDSRQVKEEGELLVLETSVLVKTSELEERTHELVLQRAALQRHTEERLEALRERYAKEAAAQAAEVRSLDGARFEKQLQVVRDRRVSTEESLRELREHAALLLHTEPYSDAGVRVALARAASSSTAGVDTPGAAGEAAAAETAADSQIEGAVERAVALLRTYCDQRLLYARDRLVDHVHASALDAAHTVRRGREQAWMADAVEHKERFSRHTVEMMERCMAFYKERALLKQENMSALQADARQAAAELRRHAAGRLQDLLRDVTAKIELSTQRHSDSAAGACAQLHAKANTVLEGDLSLADARRRELESRLLTEAHARRQRHLVEETSLTEQLQRLRRSSEEACRSSFQTLRDAAGATSTERAEPLHEEVLGLKSAVVDRLHSRGSHVPSARSSARLNAEELAHAVRTSLTQEAALQQAASSARQRCTELRRSVAESCGTEVVERLRQARCVQHARQSRIDSVAKAWSAAHRQNLAAACSLILPVSGNTAGSVDAEYTSDTYAAPQDVTSAALLDVLVNKLQARDEVRRVSLASRRQGTAALLRRLEEMREGQVAVQERCTAVWSAALAQVVQQRATHEAELEIGKSLAEVVAAHRQVDRERRATERGCRRIAEMTAHARDDALSHRLCAPLPLAPQPARGAAAEDGQSQLLGSLDANILRKAVSSNNNFTAVHVSTNVAATTAAHKSAAGTRVSSPRTTFSTASPALPAALPARPEGRHPPSVAELDWAANTQPWSAALLRAEQQLPHDGGDAAADEHAASAPPPLSLSPDDPQRTRHAFDSTCIGDAHLQGDATARVSSVARLCRHPADTPFETASGRPPSHRRTGSARAAHDDTADEKQHSASSSRHAARRPPASSTWTDSDSTPSARHRGVEARSAGVSARGWHSRADSAVPGAARSQPTWSTLEEYRSSSADPPGVLAPSLDETHLSATPHAGTSASLDTSGDSFLELLSCNDSPASSSSPPALL